MSAIIEALQRPGALPNDAAVEQRIETHVSIVLLAGDRAWKLKRHVNRGFLDFTTLEARKRDSFEELRLNRRVAPDLYLGVWPVIEEGNGVRVVRDEAPKATIVDWVVEMRRLPAEGMLDRALARGDANLGALLERFASELAAFHASAATGGEVDASGAFPRIEARVRENLSRLRQHAPLSRTFVERIDAATNARLARIAATLERRRENGRVRDGHGDLHARNLCIVDDRIIAYDCLEFQSAYRCVDVASDVAFLAMDLDARGRPDLAERFVDAYVQASGDHELRLIEKFFRLHYAIIRAMVESIRFEEAPANSRERDAIRVGIDNYAALAAGYIVEPALVVMTGLPATGKSSIARLIAQPLRAAIVRSDEVRKRLAGISATTRGDEALYSESRTKATYEATRDEAAAHLRGGRSAIVDAANLKREQRRMFVDLATRLGVRWIIVEATASDETIRRRMTERASDASEVSDATLRVYESLRATREPIDEVAREAVVTIDEGTADAALRTMERLVSLQIDADMP